MSWRDAIFSKIDSRTLFVAGKEGVWKSINRGKSFHPLDTGFPSSAYEKDTFCLLTVKNDNNETLFAGTRSGLFYQKAGVWQRIIHPVLKSEAVIDLLQIDKQILAFTKDAAFKARITDKPPTFTKLPLLRKPDSSPQMPLFRWLRKVHNGSILGFQGRIIVDLIGLISQLFLLEKRFHSTTAGTLSWESSAPCLLP